MSRSIVGITADHLAALDGPCASCLFWERDPVRRREAADPAEAKKAWVVEVLEEWGTCGQVVLVDGVPRGFALYAPAAFVPGAAAFPTAPVSPDAVLLTTVYVDPTLSGGGVGKMLVQRMARDLVRRRVRAVEAFGDGGAPSDTVPCRLPVTFLEDVGFTTHRAHGTTPRMRLDLRRAVTWKSEVTDAVERLVGAVRPVPKPTRAQRVASSGRVPDQAM